MRISEVSRRSKVPATTIRYYEDLEILPAPRRVSGRRDHSPADFERLIAIRALQRAGFRLSEIREMVRWGFHADERAERWRAAAKEKLVETDRAIAELTERRELLAQAMDCPCDRKAESCVLVEAVR